MRRAFVGFIPSIFTKVGSSASLTLESFITLITSLPSNFSIDMVTLYGIQLFLLKSILWAYKPVSNSKRNVINKLFTILIKRQFS